jgi:hypothetical protein
MTPGAPLMLGAGLVSLERPCDKLRAGYWGEGSTLCTSPNPFFFAHHWGHPHFGCYELSLSPDLTSALSRPRAAPAHAAGRASRARRSPA